MIALGWSSGAAAQVAPEKQAIVLTRALAYDNNLRGRAGDSVVIAILYRAGSGDAAADTAMRAFKALEGVKVQDLPMKVVKLPFSGKDALKAAIGPQGIDALYCCPGLDGDVAAIREVSHAAHVLTLASKEEYIAAGLAIGVFTVDGKATITVNLAASRDEGAALSSELLRLAKVVR